MKKQVIYQNWVQGEKYVVNEAAWNDVQELIILTIQLPAGTIELYTGCKEEQRRYHDGKRYRNWQIQF